jgi:putative addiction module killer protein
MVDDQRQPWFTSAVFEVRQTAAFAEWLNALGDLAAQARVLERLRRLQGGNFGDSKSVGEGVSELRMDFGPGYRAYYVRRGKEVILLLCGGDKATQKHDIIQARKLAKEF